MNTALVALGAAVGAVGLAVAELTGRLRIRPIPARVESPRRRPPSARGS